MAKTSTNLEQETRSQVEQEPNLKGTLFSVMILGIFIILTWFGAFYLFISRF